MEYISSDIRNKNFIVDKIQDIPVELYTKTSPTKRKYDIFMAPIFVIRSQWAKNMKTSSKIIC